MLPTLAQRGRNKGRRTGSPSLVGMLLALAVLAALSACTKPGDPSDNEESGGPYVPPPPRMEIAEEADAAPAELAQADRDPKEETPAECFARCNELRRDKQTEARFKITVGKCQVACQDKCIRQCVRRGKRRDLFKPGELETACREGCVVQR